MEKKQALIVGGTSGLGLELAKLLQHDYAVTVTGRYDPQAAGLRYVAADLKPKLNTYGSLANPLASSLDALFGYAYEIDPHGQDFCPGCLDHVSLFVYAAGFYQEGTIDQLSDDQIDEMNSVGLGACQKMLARILRNQGSLDGFIAITSTSEWTPRLKEPVYNGAKAGLKLLAEAVSLDPRIGKTLVAAPAGMRTEFWRGTGRDTSLMLHPTWVAKQILAQYADAFRFTHMRILRDPARVAVTQKA